MAKPKQIEAALNKIINGFVDLKEALQTEENHQGVPEQPKVSVQNVQPIEGVTENEIQSKSDGEVFEMLKKAVFTDKWPAAVNSNLVCDPNSETDKIERGKGIVELMVEEDLKDLKFLDIGCGEGHCAYISADYGTTKSVGYDIKANTKWAEWTGKENSMFTVNWEEVVTNGPYDVIMIFDVLDHIENETPKEMLEKAKSVLAEGGKIYMRCHPWVSRHATHLYHDLNKAYIHLVFTPQELKQLVPDSKFEEPNIGVTFPIKTYCDWIAETGLQVLNRRDITDKVEEFFKIPKIAERIITTTKFDSFPEFQLGIQFIDFVLKK